MKRMIGAIAKTIITAAAACAFTLPNGQNASVKKVYKDGDTIVKADLAEPLWVRNDAYDDAFQIHNTVEFYASGKIKTCNLVENKQLRHFSPYDFIIDHFRPIELYESGYLKSAYVKNETRFENVHKGYVTISRGQKVTFFEKNILQTFYPAVDTFVYVKSLSGDKDEKIPVENHQLIELYDTGYVKSFTAADKLSLQTAYGIVKTAPGKGQLIVYQNGIFGLITVGEISQLTVSSTQIMIAASSTVAFYPTGKIMSLTADSSEKKIVLDGTEYTKDSDQCMVFNFDEEGNVKETGTVSQLELSLRN